MNILYVITKKEGEETSKITLESLDYNLDNDKLFIKELNESDFDTQLYYSYITEDKHLLAEIDYVVIIPNHSYLEPKYKEKISDYIDIDKKNELLLPFALLINEESTKGILNTCLWTEHALEISKLDHELALKQTDTVLYGALIPKEFFFNEEYYNKDLKYYQHYSFLNKITSIEENEVIGIPKILINLDLDLTFNHIDKNEKIANYKLAREKFVSALNEQQ